MDHLHLDLKMEVNLLVVEEAVGAAGEVKGHL
jgi:hypothetical protein